MNKISPTVLVISAAIILGACTNGSAKSAANSSPSATQQPVKTDNQIKYTTYQDSQTNLSFQHPQDFKVSPASASGDTRHSAQIETGEKDVKEVFRVEVKTKQPTKAELEDIDSDNYNGKDRTLNGIKYTCYERMNSYIKDTFKQKGQAYAGPTPDVGYRIDCFGKRKDGSFITVFYQNNVNDRHLLRRIQDSVTKILETAE